ncbi:hypothetical protein [Vandammella animalimorsus]|uniref:Type II secretion system protein GspC N-terminal domain-containing protein n=1 Tax=Vandammella animalimorsus TaxID=2029117 RepID=A0A2A2AFK4_9BURK|nr:hypothetical protein [Vandammella animalimorsus]PAT36553.1 hypothetical protein CK625_10740 [Vandammella animalimorsus]
MNTPRSSIALLWLLNLALALALALAWLLWGRSRWTAPPAIAPDYTSALQGAALPGQLQLADYPTITQKPLFELERKWPDPAPPPQTPPAPPPEPEPAQAFDSARLLGVYDQDGQGVVIVEIEGKSRRLRLGQSLEGWTLSALDARSARFTRSGQSAKILSIERRRPPVKDHAAPGAAPAALPGTAIGNRRPIIAPVPAAAPRPLPPR